MSKIFIGRLLLVSLLALGGCFSPSRNLVPDKEGTGNDTPELPDKNEVVKPAASSRYNSFNVVGVDKFGRVVETVRGYKKGRTVGMFFWPWIGQPYASGIYDATKILSMPNGVKILTDFKTYDPKISPDGQAHFWGEPLWGYYNSDDEWVIRKQMRMLTDAGIDFIFFDTTNALIYENVVLKMMKVINDMIEGGWNPPRVVFYTHSHSLQTTATIYNNIYKPNKYSKTWYMMDGKPAIVAYTNVEDDLREAASRNDTSYKPEPLSAEILGFFHFLKPQWPSDPVYDEGFPWVEWSFPQPLHKTSKVMNVTVASHPMVPMSFSLTRSGWTNWGRGWDVKSRRNVSADVDKGTFFQSQWDNAIAQDPEIISVGGWNEWIAYKQPYDGEYMLCDAANKEYSRDIEPMKGGYEDSFYLQLIRNVRRYKGIKVGDIPSNPSKKIDMDGPLSQWSDVEYVERNPDDRFVKRDAFGASKEIHYSQAAPVDKLEEIRVAHDKDSIWFYIKGADKFSAWSGRPEWLNILVGTGDPQIKAWESYDYIVRSDSPASVSVGRLTKTFDSQQTGKGGMVVKDDVILVSVPRSAISSDQKIYFKVAMGVNDGSDIMNYYQSGCSMPMGRLSYMYCMSNK